MIRNKGVDVVFKWVILYLLVIKFKFDNKRSMGVGCGVRDKEKWWGFIGFKLLLELGF